MGYGYNRVFGFLQQLHGCALIPAFSREFAVSPDALSWLVPGFSIAYGVSTLIELRVALIETISELRKNLRILFLLCESQGLTIEEAAQRLGLTVAAVKARNFHARR
jgi:DNA-directed RNA polymerase specialized sigma24 family protein